MKVELTDAQWVRIAKLLPKPKAKPKSGRPPGYSSRSAPFACQSRRVAARPRNARPSSRPAPRCGPAEAETATHHRRPRLRLPSALGAREAARHSVDRAAPLHSQTPLSGRPLSPTIQAPLDHRTHQRLTAQLPPPRHSLRQQTRALPGLSVRRVPAHHAPPVLKPLLEPIS